jgi:hypothetical protein
MNRETERRVEDLGRAFTVAIREIVAMSEEVLDGQPTRVEDREELCDEERCDAQPTEQVLYNGNKAHYQPEISSVNNGFIVRMGCQQFVFETYDKMSKYLKMYFEDPNGTESKFHTNELFK